MVDCTICNKIHPLTWRAPGAKWPCLWAGQWRTPSGLIYCSPLIRSHRHDDAAQWTLQSPWHLESGPGRGAPEYWSENKTTKSNLYKESNKGENTKKQLISRRIQAKIQVHINLNQFWHLCAQSNMRATNLKYSTLAMIVPLGSSFLLHTGLLAKQGCDNPFQAGRNPHLNLQPIKESLAICLCQGG